VVTKGNSQTNNEELLQMAIKTAKSGNKDSARVMLRQVHQRDRSNETAMLWLAKVARTREERESWLNRILEQNPDNETAKKALEKMAYKQAARDNRTIVMFGAVAAVMLIIVLAIILILI